MHICAVAVEYETKTGRINKGVATSWLRAKEPAGENGGRALVPMYVRKSQFRLPFKATTPVIMVGPGTGVAPFIGFIQERAWLRQQGECVARAGSGQGIQGLFSLRLTGLISLLFKGLSRAFSSTTIPCIN